VAVLAVSFAGSLALSMQWEMQHDSPIMIYIARLIDGGRIPYVEIFDMNLPGTYAVHVGLARVFGTGDLGFRLADTTLLLALLATTFAALRRVSPVVATTAALLVGCAYLSYGPRRSLQREFLILLPLAASLWAVQTRRPFSRPTRFAVLGLLAGVATTIKPHAALGLPVFLWFASKTAPAVDGSGRGEAAGPKLLPMALAAAAAGFALPLVLTLVYLWSVGAVGAFWDVASGYWPLYGEIAQNLSIVSGSERLPYLVRGWLRFGAGHFADSPLDVLREGFAGWFAAAAVGFFLARRTHPASAEGARSEAPRGEPSREPSEVGQLARMLAALGVVYSFYPVASGKFWGYHWQPFLYFVHLLAALCLCPPRPGERLAPITGLVVLATTGFFLLNLDTPFRPHPAAHSTNPLKKRHEAIALYLRESLEPGDVVQPLDWTGGSIHGMLQANAELATSFVYDFHFYHHVDTPYIQALRRRFLNELSESKPRYVIDIQGLKPSVKTSAARSTFPALRTFLDVNYTLAHQGTGFVVYERIDRSRSQ
jgi:hypothetical protein